MTRRRRILFVSHDASRTGAPILFLHLLQWIKSNSSLEFEILLRAGGELEGEFRALAPTTVFGTGGRSGRSLAMRAARRLLFEAFAASARRGRTAGGVGRGGFDLVYSNTITNGDLVSRVAPAGCPVLTHVHELDSWIRRAGEENLRLVKAQTTQYVAGSEAAKSGLVERHGIDAAMVRVVHDFTSAGAFDLANAGRARADFRSSLGIPDDAMVVGTVGTVEWRKGPDLFVQLAHRVRLRQPSSPVHFVWIGGGGPEDPRVFELMEDVRKSGVASSVHFVRARATLFECYCSFDVFALMSREDPFPLVCLEAAMARKPVLCFAGAGGEPEFVEEDCGFVVPYLDVETMAERVLTLLASESLRVRMGECAARKVTARHTVAVAGPMVLDVIERLLEDTGR